MFINNINTPNKRATDSETYYATLTLAPFLFIGNKLNKVTGSFDTSSSIDSYPSDYARSIAVSQNGEYLILGLNSSPFFKGYKIKDNHSDLGPLPTSPGNLVNKVSISKDSSMVAVSISSAGLKLYTLPNLTYINQFDIGRDVSFIAFSPNSDNIAIGNSLGSPLIKIYNIATNTLIASSSIPGSQIRGLEWSVNNDEVIVLTTDSLQYTYGYNFITNQIRSGSVFANGGTVNDSNISPNGKYVVGVKDPLPNISVFDYTNLSKILDISAGGAVESACYSKNSKFLGITGDTGTVYTKIYRISGDGLTYTAMTSNGGNTTAAYNIVFL